MRFVFSSTTMSTLFELAYAVSRVEPESVLFAGYPWSRMRARGFRPDQVRTCPLPVVAWLALSRCVRSQAVAQWSEPWPKLWFDRNVAGRVPCCDVFVGTSSVGLYSGRKARGRGAFWVCERPCSHILTQNALLREEYELHGLRWPGIHHLVIERELAEYEESDRVLVASHFTKRSMVERGVPPDKVWVLPYGVNLARFFPDGDPEPDEFQVLYVGQRSLRKGLGYLLDAYEKVEHPCKGLTMIGSDTPDGAGVTERARRMPGVKVLGPMPQEQLRAHMSRAHVFVLPSVEDGYGMVVDQAMACGCPCIVSTHAGSADTVVEGLNGFTFPARDVECLTKHLRALASDGDLAAGMREHAVLTARQRGDWTAGAEKFLLLCKQALGVGS